jgi:hypothetical protein
MASAAGVAVTGQRHPAASPRRALDRPAMPLTVHPTGRSSNPDRNDWIIHEDGVEIGRLYEDLQASRPEIRWFWSITVMGPARFRVRTGNRAATLDQAKADFQAAWAVFKAANTTAGG